MPRAPKDSPQLGIDQLLAQGPAAPAGPPVLSVSELVHRASRTLEKAFGALWVEGELSSVRRISSGHVFFTLKDSRSQISCVLFRSDARRVRFRMEDGIAARCRGAVRIYEAQGRFQLYVDRVEPVGLGALMLALEQRKRALAAEGLFDPARKRPLPPYPRTVGVVTSATGAALRDILQVAGRRFPARMILSAAPVQGDEAPPRLVAALRALARVPEVEVIILGRGGGSVEDLFCFNDEALVRAVAACPKPVVSAVGHEIDTTLCDLVADVRAPTPSAASELVLPDRRAVARGLRAQADRLRAALERRLADAHLALRRGEAALPDPRPRLLDARVSLEGQRRRTHSAWRDHLASSRSRLASGRERIAGHHPRARLAARRGELERLGDRAQRATQATLRHRREALTRARLSLDHQRDIVTAPARRALALHATRLESLSPLRVLARGYAVALDPTGAALHAPDTLTVGDPIHVRLHRGAIDCAVTALHSAPELHPPDSKPQEDAEGTAARRRGPAKESD